MKKEFINLDNQFRVEIKMKYQLIDIFTDQIYYSNDLTELNRVYDEIPSSKIMYEIVSRNIKGIKKRKIKSYKPNLF